VDRGEARGDPVSGRRSAAWGTVSSSRHLTRSRFPSGSLAQHATSNAGLERGGVHANLALVITDRLFGVHELDRGSSIVNDVLVVRVVHVIDQSRRKRRDFPEAVVTVSSTIPRLLLGRVR